MKAFMSDRQERPVAVFAAKVRALGPIEDPSLCYWTSAREQDKSAAWAEHEARAILAVTEPRQEQGMSGHWFAGLPNRAWDGVSRSNDESGYLSGTAWVGHAALAEALAAFVGEPV